MSKVLLINQLCLKLFRIIKIQNHRLKKKLYPTNALANTFSSIAINCLLECIAGRYCNFPESGCNKAKSKQNRPQRIPTREGVRVLIDLFSHFLQFLLTTVILHKIINSEIGPRVSAFDSLGPVVKAELLLSLFHALQQMLK